MNSKKVGLIPENVGALLQGNISNTSKIESKLSHFYRNGTKPRRLHSEALQTYK